MFIPSLDGEWDFAQLPYEQQGLVRSMNRSAKLGVACAFMLNSAERELISRHRFETGIYCAAEPTTAAQDEVRDLMCQPRENLPKAFAQLISPKWGLQCGASMVAPTLSIFLGAEGGVHTFSYGSSACVQAVQQAQLDLQLGTIELAIVCAVSSSEDPFVVGRYKQNYPETEFTEGAVLIGLTKENSLELSPIRVASDFHFGAADPLVQTFWKSIR